MVYITPLQNSRPVDTSFRWIGISQEPRLSEGTTACETRWCHRAAKSWTDCRSFREEPGKTNVIIIITSWLRKDRIMYEIFSVFTIQRNKVLLNRVPECNCLQGLPHRQHNTRLSDPLEGLPMSSSEVSRDDTCRCTWQTIWSLLSAKHISIECTVHLIKTDRKLWTYVQFTV